MKTTGKSSYLLICGVKEWRENGWVQLRGRSSPYSAIKIENREDCYSDVIEKLRIEFDIHEKNLVLVDMSNNSITSNETFNVYNYVQSHKKYALSRRKAKLSKK